MAILATIISLLVQVGLGLLISWAISKDSYELLTYFSAYMVGTLGADYYAKYKLVFEGEQNDKDKN